MIHARVSGRNREYCTMSKDFSSDFMRHLSGLVMCLVQQGMCQNPDLTFIPAAFDAERAAEYIGIGRTKLFEYRDAGEIDTVEVGGRPKYLRKDLDKLLAKLERAAKTKGK